MNMETTVMGMQRKSQVLIDDLRSIIDGARRQVAVAANSEMTMMYWHIGERINREVLGNQRAEYGKQIVATVSTQLQENYGTKGFDVKNIHRMMKFARMFNDVQIVAPLARQSGKSEFDRVYNCNKIFQTVIGKSLK